MNKMYIRIPSNCFKSRDVARKMTPTRKKESGEEEKRPLGIIMSVNNRNAEQYDWT